MPIRQDDNQPNRRFGIINLVLIGFGVLLLASSFLPSNGMQQVPRVPYSLFIDQVNDGAVKRAFITQDQIRYELSDPEEGTPPVLATTPIFDMDLPQRLETKGVEFAAAPPKKPNIFTTILSWVVPPLIFILVLQFFARRSMGGGAQGALSFTKSKAKVYVPDEESRITFADVAGVDEAKQELTEIVDFLKRPERYAEIGARIPKGVLLVGPPGTGKTLLSKAVAGEAEVPFFIISGSEFVELFVGAGAARVRDLFEEAKKKAPCIIFIDELDAIGKSRSGSMGVVGGNDEREQTLNQLLTEMDGFTAQDKPVIVLAATNQPEVLDAALLRPGRFDRQVLVDRPDLSGRKTILEIYAKKVKLAAGVDLDSVAQATSGFAGADLANLVNEAALLAARAQRTSVEQQDLGEAIERVVAGLEKKSRVLQDDEKKVVAYHEVGHAIVGHLMPGGSKVAKISIVPRGMSALGYTLQLPTEERFLNSKEELQGQIATLLGGRSAEEIVFGKITTGAANDLQRATDLAEQMVGTYGMSDTLGPLAYDKQGGGRFLGGGNNPRRSVSDATAQAIDKEVRGLVDQAHDDALAILRENMALLETIAQKILEKEVIEGDDLKQMLEASVLPSGVTA
ncbi:MAG: ATP-dependent zinc metalloprotease FtsH [Cyanobacteria bacterium MAG STY4_bin_9]|jgi:cell division protease FtsH|uniref:ATP-dependent zinc metalloprotease FtsH n=1 Tax=unclassified Synechococcus TaxID=2626047 RepID=UPI0001B8E158|nr:MULTISPECIES: ATP-dependent zinc metalloprotease FtsH [unclassified Synechococcus]MCY4083529.1 ATP-dependent zinc metalloprotease FtsH [Cyanobacteria bacterium MAG COS1_bin_9]MDD9804782.1 ATP-dependent zinc metalloprotease FtsH [Cyanobacteria bacterium MAG STY1_bin_7]MDD9862839.1 ATP-dependent zinc metalloprotease FtsH [Cyanobacteria bacterium MAG STY2_bin_7]MDD9881152.1 ATP-dependent zinc metalloprotease FtsH [Cyanobacteria bacterium MAG STY4_bin_9]AHF64168.1 ATP-dependent metalloprotease 